MTSQPAPQPRARIFLLDWDDTLHPTSYVRSSILSYRYYGPLSLEDTNHLDALGQTVIDLINEIKQYGKITIITSAMEGWVEFSSARYLPSVYKFLFEGDQEIKVISAREQGKTSVFTDLTTEAIMAMTEPFGPLHIFVFGDSEEEMEAGEKILDTYEGELPLSIRRVKLRGRPSLSFLRAELNALANALPEMISSPFSFYLKVADSADSS